LVPAEVLIQAIEFMALEDPPTHDEIHQLIALMKGPSIEEIDFALMKETFVIANTLKENMDRATNCFLKEPARMTQQEYSASMFFRELVFILDKNRWTPDDLFSKIDHDGSGDVDKKEMEREVRTFAKSQPIPMTKSLSVEHPFDMLDLNNDQMVSREEFVHVFNQVREARDAQKDMEVRHPIFMAASGFPKQEGRSQERRIFGRRAFVEVLLKIALVHLSFHGTAHQAEQTSLFKAVWLMLYMHSHFQRAKARGIPIRKGKLATPMQRLIRDHPDLFKHGGEVSDAVIGGVWGSEVDELLQECFEFGPPKASGRNSLDGHLLALAVN
jgi:hypothetical protein